MIRQVEVYETMGQQFATLSKAIEFREGLIEKFLRELPGFQDLPAKSRIEFVQSIINQREKLSQLLDYRNKAD